MNETGLPDLEQARQLVRQWLTTQNRSLRNLAQEAGVQPSIISRFLQGETTLEVGSALKLYIILQAGMNAAERKSYIQALRLQPFITAFSRDALFMIDRQWLPYELSSRLLILGMELHNQMAYEEAIPVLRAAEAVIVGGSSQSAFAACTLAQMFINLGNYRQAQAEAVRIEQTYGSLLDAETKAELYRIHNWVEYYQGNYDQSEQWLRQRIQLGEEAGIERLTNQHFLGRIYYDCGCVCQDPAEAARLFQQALLCFEQSHQINLRWSNEHNCAFDLFRQSQVLQAQGKGTEAKRLRLRASQIFNSGSLGGSVALLNIKLEEAKLLVEQGELAFPKHSVASILTAWAHQKYPKGIADSLTVLGELAYMQGQLEQTLEIYVARLCVYPYDNYPSSRQVWADVQQLQQEVIKREGRKTYQEMLQRLHLKAEQREGYFAYLNAVVVDQTAEIARIFSRLQPPSC